MASTGSNVFADLSLDIIHDVLHIGCPKLEDLELLEQTESAWGAAIRGGSLRRTKLKVSSGWEGDYTTERYEYGHSLTTMPLKRMDDMKDWSMLHLTDVKVEIYDSTPKEASNRVFRHATGSVSVTANSCTPEERITEILDILSARPITKLRFFYLFKEDSLPAEAFRRNLNNPTLRQLDVCRVPLNEKDANEALMSFIKKPNFVDLTLDIENYGLMSALLEHWSQLTSFPTHMQRVRFEITITNNSYEYLLQRFNFREVASTSTFANCISSPGSYIYYLDHPNDEAKRIECVTCNTRYLELCLTSKEASVWSEWSEYETFKLRKYIHENEFFELLEGKDVGYI